MSKQKIERNEMIRQDFAAGYKVKLIEAKYGLTRQRIHQICKGIQVQAIEPATQGEPAKIDEKTVAE